MAQPTPSAAPALTGDDIMYLLTMLRNAPYPLSTQQLVDALKGRVSRS